MGKETTFNYKYRAMLIVFVNLIFISCKKEQITVSGYLVDERDGGHFNPFSNATVRLVLDQGYGYTNELVSTTVSADGHYEITVKAKPGITARLQLYAEENAPQYMDQTETLNGKTTHDFIIYCHAKLNRVFARQSSVSFDSVVINLTNSKGTTRYLDNFYGMYRDLSTIELRGDENNYLLYNIYSNGLYAQHCDTINPGCRTTIKDTIRY
jgi:hypothetical protein